MKRRKITNCFKLPNRIILDTNLTYSAKVVAATIYACRNALGVCRLGLHKLAKYTGCSVTTVRDALVRLENAGYISIYRNYAWSHEHGRCERRKDTIICQLSISTNFSFVARSALRAALKKSTFTVYLLICQLSGNNGRAFPSLRHVADVLAMGIATVCRAVKELNESILMYREKCIKSNGAHTSNSYFLIQNQYAATEPSVCTNFPVADPLVDGRNETDSFFIPSILTRKISGRKAKKRAPHVCTAQLQIPFVNTIIPRGISRYNRNSKQGVLSFLTS